MPSNLLSVDTSFPTFTPDQSNEEKLDVVTNYLYMLMEQLRYTLANLGAGNFNDAELNEIGMTITQPIYVDLENAAGAIADLTLTADQLTSRLEDAEGDISSIDQYAKSITMQVTNGETSSTIKLLAGGVQIASQIIQMDGLVTFTGLEDGTTVINGGCIQTGTIDAEYLNLTGAITFSDLSDAVYNDIDDALTTANDAYNLAYDNQLPDYIHNTYISSTEIRSPTIKAGEFYGATYYNLAGDYWMEMSERGEWGAFRLYNDVYSTTVPYFSIYDAWSAGSITLIAVGAPFLRVTNDMANNANVIPQGAWDFSDADVIGLSGSGSSLEGTNVDIYADQDINIDAGDYLYLDSYNDTEVYSSQGDIILSANKGDIRLSAASGEVRIYVDGVTWHLDRDGWWS